MAKEQQTGIMELNTPQEMDAGKWLEDHLDCDAIVDDHGSRILVYAYATDSAYNHMLYELRNKRYNDHRILRGISSVGLGSIF